MGIYIDTHFSLHKMNKKTIYFNGDICENKKNEIIKNIENMYNKYNNN